MCEIELMQSIKIKRCPTCGETDILKFNKNKSRKDGLQNICINCSKERNKKYRKENVWYKEKARNNKLKFDYNITTEKYNELFNKQDGKCAICGTKEKDKTRYGRLVIDHCHKTNKIRGLLCKECNTALGLSFDDINVLKKAIEYLKNVNIQQETK